MSTNRYFVYEGKTLRAAQPTLELALRYVNEDRSVWCIAQALDGRWNYGPYMMKRQLESEERGTFPNPAAAIRAMRIES